MSTLLSSPPAADSPVDLVSRLLQERAASEERAHAEREAAFHADAQKIVAAVPAVLGDELWNELRPYLCANADSGEVWTIRTSPMGRNRPLACARVEHPTLQRVDLTATQETLSSGKPSPNFRVLLGRVGMNGVDLVHDSQPRPRLSDDEYASVTYFFAGVLEDNEKRARERRENDAYEHGTRFLMVVPITNERLNLNNKNYATSPAAADHYLAEAIARNPEMEADYRTLRAQWQRDYEKVIARMAREDARERALAQYRADKEAHEHALASVVAANTEKLAALQAELDARPLHLFALNYVVLVRGFDEDSGEDKTLYDERTALVLGATPDAEGFWSVLNVAGSVQRRRIFSPNFLDDIGLVPPSKRMESACLSPVIPNLRNDEMEAWYSWLHFWPSEFSTEEVSARIAALDLAPHPTAPTAPAAESGVDS